MVDLIGIQSIVQETYVGEIMRDVLEGLVDPGVFFCVGGYDGDFEEVVEIGGESVFEISGNIGLGVIDTLCWSKGLGRPGCLAVFELGYVSFDCGDDFGWGVFDAGPGAECACTLGSATVFDCSVANFDVPFAVRARSSPIAVQCTLCKLLSWNHNHTCDRVFVVYSVEAS